MIYYFSGTGNSRYVAKQLSSSTGQTARFIPMTDPYAERFNPNTDSSIGFVFPVYSWGPAPIVLDFIRRLPQKLIEDARALKVPVWVVATCGDEAGNTIEIFRKALRCRGLELAGAWTVIMPNVYVLLPGFGTDPMPLERKKLREAPARIAGIADKIAAAQWQDDVATGSFPFLRSIIYPLFRRWGVNPKKWHYEPACISCGKCAAACPVGNIAMVGGHPRWGSDCTSCCACFHACPTESVQYGRITRKMGHYTFRNPSELS